MTQPCLNVPMIPLKWELQTATRKPQGGRSLSKTNKANQLIELPRLIQHHDSLGLAIFRSFGSAEWFHRCVEINQIHRFTGAGAHESTSCSQSSWRAFCYSIVQICAEVVQNSDEFTRMLCLGWRNTPTYENYIMVAHNGELVDHPS